MLALFFIPLLCIAFWETNLDEDTNMYMKNWFSPSDENEEENPEFQDPEVKGEGGKVISKVPFADIVKRFPDTTVVRRHLRFVINAKRLTCHVILSFTER